MEKDFVAFGHQCASRAGLGRERGHDRHHDEQSAPILLQFLDCVWQLTELLPAEFEFGSRYLVAVADALYSNRFSTFLFDREAARDVKAGDAASLWPWPEGHRAVLRPAVCRLSADEVARLDRAGPRRLVSLDER